MSIQEYDRFDRPTRLRFPNASGVGTSTTDYEEATIYDPAGNVLSFRDRAGVTFSTTYDNLNRPTLLDAPGTAMDVTYGYDNLGRVLTVSIPSQTTTLAWDALGRQTSETGPVGTMAYQYDLAGRRTRQTWPDSFYVTNSWNLANEMTAILHGGSTQIVGYGYDDLGRRTGVTRGNGVGSTYGYDAAGRLSSLSHDVGGTAADVTFTYGYNPAGQIVSRGASNGAYVAPPTANATTAYVNDGRNRVTSAGGVGHRL